MSIDVTADAGSENQLGAQVSAPTVWELTFAEPAMLLPSVPEPGGSAYSTNSTKSGTGIVIS